MYFSVVADYSPLMLSGGIQFTPVLSQADLEKFWSGQAPAAGFNLSPQAATLNDGVLQASGTNRIRLQCDSTTLGLSSPLVYRVDFLSINLDDQRVKMDSVMLPAPTSEQTIDLTQLAPAPAVGGGGTGGGGTIEDGNKGDIAVSGGGAIWRVNSGLSADKLADGTVNKLLTVAERSKLAGIAIGATANAPDTALRDRGTHTGLQPSSTISDFVEAVQDAVAAMMAGGSGVTLAYNDAAGTLTIASTGGSGTTDVEAVQDAIGTAMSGLGLITVTYNDAANAITISTSATQNSTDAALRDRQTHTGMQSASTISNLAKAVMDTVGSSTDGVGLVTVVYDSVNSIISVSTTATQNQPDAFLLNRANHSGQQSSATISDWTEAVQDAVAALMQQGSGVTLTYNDAAGTLTIADTGGGGTTDVEAVQDAIGSAMSGIGLITVTYNDAANAITISTAATQNSTDAALRDRGTHTGTQSADTIVDGLTNKVFLGTEKTKLAGIATNATANQADSYLLDRSHHTGQQASNTISDLTEAVQDIVGQFLAAGANVTVNYDDPGNTITVSAAGGTTDPETVRDTIGAALIGLGLVQVTVNDAADTITVTTTATQNDTDANLRDRGTHTGVQSADTLIDGSTNRLYSTTEKNKLAGIAVGATANSADSYLLDRTHHTGQQTASTISDFSSAADARVNALAVLQSLVDAKGDLLVGSADNTVARLAASGGTTGQVLTRDTAAALGLKWADAPAGGGGTTHPAYIGFVGDGVHNTLTVNHGLNTQYVDVTVFRASAPFDELDIRPERTNPNVVTFNNDEVWTLNQYVIMVEWVAQSDVTAPTPGTLVFSSSTSNSLTFTFSGQSDTDSGIASIDAYDADTNALIQAGVTSPFTRSSLSASTDYGTYLKVTDNAGNSAVTPTVRHTTDAPAGDTTAPTPGAAAFVSATSSSLTYSYGLGTDNVGVTQIDAYDVGGTLLQANIGTSGSYTRNGLTASTSYGTFFRYRDAAGNFADSAVVTHSTSAPPATISYIDAKAEKGSNLSVMPTHQANDLLIMFAYRDGFNTPPSAPAGWTVIGTPPTGVNSNCMTVAYKIAASSSEVSGTWTNATNCGCICYRGVASIGAVQYQDGTGTTITIPALTLQKTDGTSWVVVGAGDRSGANTLNLNPTGLTYRAGYDGTSTEQDTGVYGTGGGVSSFAGTTISYATSTGWFTCAVELRAS